MADAGSIINSINTLSEFYNLQIVLLPLQASFYASIKFLDFIQHLILVCIIFSLLLNLGNEVWNLHRI